MNKSILITGSSGMVGKALVKLLNKNYKILTPSSKKLDLNNYKNLIKYLKKEKPTHIVHLAGYVGGIGANINNPINFLQHNIYMGLNLIKISNEKLQEEYNFLKMNKINFKKKSIIPWIIRFCPYI